MREGGMRDVDRKSGPLLMNQVLLFHGCDLQCPNP